MLRIEITSADVVWLPQVKRALHIPLWQDRFANEAVWNRYTHHRLIELRAPRHEMGSAPVVRLGKIGLKLRRSIWSDVFGSSRNVGCNFSALGAFDDLAGLREGAKIKASFAPVLADRKAATELVA